MAIKEILDKLKQNLRVYIEGSSYKLGVGKIILSKQARVAQTLLVEMQSLSSYETIDIHALITALDETMHLSILQPKGAGLFAKPQHRLMLIGLQDGLKKIIADTKTELMENYLGDIARP